MLSFLNFKYLALLLVAVAAVAAIGNAAALTITPTPNVVQGDSGAYVVDTVDVTYTLGATGGVTATLAFLTDDFDVVSFSHDGTNYVACSDINASLPSDDWACVMTKEQAASSTGIDIVAGANSGP